MENNKHPWFDSLIDRFEELRNLPIGWDGYQGKPVSAGTILFAGLLLMSLHVEGVPAPQLVPGPDGTLQIEWHHGGMDIELDLFGNGEFIATMKKSDVIEELNISLDDDYTIIKSWLKESNENI